jgi:predicted ATPase
MRVTQLKISNYKSLRSVEFAPQPLSVVVGANAAGKSNLADCLDFISDVYRHGLETAVQRKAGYENIAFRRQQRSRQAIEIHLVVEFSADDLRQMGILDSVPSKLKGIKFEHSFAFVASSRSIRAPFKIIREDLSISEWKDDEWNFVGSFKRRGQSITVEPTPQGSKGTPPDNTRNIFFEFSGFLEHEAYSPTDLIIPFPGFYWLDMNTLVDAVGSTRVFQISPGKSREAGVPTPHAELDRYGGNLPAVVDAMQKTRPKEWGLVMEVMRGILPDLHDIEVSYTTSHRLGLFFREKGFGRPWGVEEVSDGTIQTLALLVAIFDPSSTVLVLEEPENSVHPWIIRHIMDACRQASSKKQIILTTHSPMVINSVRPEEVWVIWRESGESHLKKLTQLDQDVATLWETGMVSTFDYLNTGALLQAIPPAPSDSFMLDEVS